MHFEILVEDLSGKYALEHLVPGILGPQGEPHTWRIFSYRGVGRIPRNLNATRDPSRRILLDNLPRLLRGYGTSLASTNATVVVVVDTDNREWCGFLRDLQDLLSSIRPRPRTLFRLAIEEMEAWYLGDRAAILEAYPKANRTPCVGRGNDLRMPSTPRVPGLLSNKGIPWLARRSANGRNGLRPT
jgi:hypothetical protein